MRRLAFACWVVISVIALTFLPGHCEDLVISIKLPDVGLLRSPDLDAEVIRTAAEGEKLVAVTTVKDFYLVQDEQTGSFLYVPFVFAYELKDEVPEDVLISGQMSMPYHVDLSYWQVGSSDSELISMRTRSKKGMRTAPNGKNYPSSYEYQLDYKPCVNGRKLIADAREFLGTKYVLGGVDQDGIDCSGLTQVCLAKQGLDLVHRSSLQALEGRYIEYDRLRPGDLVFFRDDKDSRYLSHVGIYIGQDKFIHASQSKGGVVITSLNDSYFKSHYAFARRL